jgi:hypothetical protein
MKRLREWPNYNFFFNEVNILSFSSKNRMFTMLHVGSKFHLRFGGHADQKALNTVIFLNP